jgi:hypothetical protein
MAKVLNMDDQDTNAQRGSEFSDYDYYLETSNFNSQAVEELAKVRFSGRSISWSHQEFQV